VYSDLLAKDDPLLERVKRSAPYSDDALAWLCESVRHWARGEFVRRMELKDQHPELRWVSDHLDEFEVMREYYHHTVAVLTRHMMGTDRNGKPVHREEIIVGLCEPDTTGSFVSIRTGRTDMVRGVFDVLDIVRWPKEYELRKWPSEADKRPTAKPLNLSPSVRCTKCGDTGTLPVFNKVGGIDRHIPCPDCKTGGKHAIDDAIRAMRDMQEVRVSLHVRRKLVEQATALDSSGLPQQPIVTRVFGVPVVVDGRLRANDIMGMPDQNYIQQPGQIEHECPRCGTHTICWTLTGERPVPRCINCGHGP
jgi:hypothetical protein